MPKINKAPETMTSKQRVMRTFNFEKTDRVPIGYESNPGIHARLCTALGVKSGDNEALYMALGVDTRGVGAPYTGPELFEQRPDRRVDSLEGCYMRWVEHKSGGYWDFCDFPLKDAPDELFYTYPVPNPDDFDYDMAKEWAKSSGDFALFVGGAGTPDIINSNGRIMGMEDVLIHLASEHEPAMDFIKRRAAFALGHMERLLAACRNLIDFVWLGEDLGTQIGPMISLQMYRKTFKPIHMAFVDLATSYGLPVMIHTCGSSSWVYEDFIEMGIKGVDTLQPEAANMSPQYLVENFGGRLNFRGCISTAGPLAYGSAEETAEYCRDTLDIMMEKRGYHFAPTHAIQDNTPTENVIAMYNAAHSHGRY